MYLLFSEDGCLTARCFQAHSGVCQLHANRSPFSAYLPTQVIIFPLKLLQNIEWGPLSQTVSPDGYVSYIVVCTCQSQTPNLSLPQPFLPDDHYTFVL